MLCSLEGVSHSSSPRSRGLKRDTEPCGPPFYSSPLFVKLISPRELWYVGLSSRMKWVYGRSSVSCRSNDCRQRPSHVLIGELDMRRLNAGNIVCGWILTSWKARTRIKMSETSRKTMQNLIERDEGCRSPNWIRTRREGSTSVHRAPPSHGDPHNSLR